MSAEENALTIHFCKVGDAFGFLSNFAPYPIELDRMVWPTTEHYFQANKFQDPSYREKIRRAKSPLNAAQLGRNKNFPLRPDWESIKDTVMYQAILAKFSQHLDIRMKLIATGESRLIEHTPRDSYWGDGGDGTGANRLGQLLMDARQKFRQEEDQQKASQKRSSTKDH